MRLLVLPLLMLVAGCGPKVALRDATTYRVELDQYHKWAVSQAAYLRGFIEAHCECGDPFVSEDCAKAADFVLTVEARADWHKQMSLWNSGLLQKEPAAQPPEIAPLSCPLPPAPTGK